MNSCQHEHNCIECRRDYHCYNPECVTLKYLLCGACVWQAGKIIKEAAKEVHGDDDVPKARDNGPRRRKKTREEIGPIA